MIFLFLFFFLTQARAAKIETDLDPLITNN